jgi:hypothetical protein
MTNMKANYKCTIVGYNIRFNLYIIHLQLMNYM